MADVRGGGGGGGKRISGSGERRGEECAVQARGQREEKTQGHSEGKGEGQGKATASSVQSASSQVAASPTSAALAAASSAAASTAVGGEIPLPAHWDADPSDSQLIRLDPAIAAHKAERDAVIKRFSDGGGILVSDVHRVQNAALHRAYEKRAAEWRAQTGAGLTADQTVYHGTSNNDPKLIVKNGFNVSYGSAMPGHLWFAAQSSYSAGGYMHITSSGQRQIFEVRLCPLVNEAGAAVYTVNDSNRILPAYLITF